MAGLKVDVYSLMGQSPLQSATPKRTICKEWNMKVAFAAFVQFREHRHLQDLVVALKNGFCQSEKQLSKLLFRKLLRRSHVAVLIDRCAEDYVV